MRSRVLKLTILAVLSLFAFYHVLSNESAMAFSGGPPESHTGAPGEQTCSECHGGGPPGGTLTLAGVPANYTLGAEVTLTLTLSQADRGRYGFQLTAIDDQGRQAGTIVLTEATRTQLLTGSVGGNTRQYIEHTSAGNAPSAPGEGKWTFKWQAPAASVGRVTFYAAGNAANGNFTTSGDSIYTTSVATQPGQPALPNFATISAAGTGSSASLTPDAIVAGYGQNLSPGDADAPPGQPLPDSLLGVRVRVIDSGGNERGASLLAVRPTQINYIIPTEAATGQATVRVLRDGNPVAEGKVQIDPIAPGIFTANFQGTGLAAANIFRRRTGQPDVFEPVATYDNTGQPVAVPIDLGPEGDVVALILYGTGWRRGLVGNTSVTISGSGAGTQVLFVGAVPGFVGLDQANILLDRNTFSNIHGLANVELTVDGRKSNIVQVNFK